MLDNSRWSWEDIYALLSREREVGEALCLHRRWIKEPPERAGAVPVPGRPGRHRLPVSDGSFIDIQEQGEELVLTLIAAPLPMVGWTGEMPPLGWVALPACLLLLGALGAMV